MKNTTGRVIVRTYSAGVHYGELLFANEKVVTLGQARRIWYWRGANTLNEIANHGVDIEGSRISEAVEQIVLTEAIEIIPCTADAVLNLENAKWKK
jgi:hypothetical protein